MNGERPIIEMEIVDRPETADPETMWDQLIELCETDADFDALMDIYDEAMGK